MQKITGLMGAAAGKAGKGVLFILKGLNRLGLRIKGTFTKAKTFEGKPPSIARENPDG
jgi:hypothetical protein